MAAQAAEPQPSPLVDSIVDDRYRVQALIGRGAVGAVYRAVELATGAQVALKQWHGSVVDEQVRGRFLREAKALDTLDHPNIVKVYGHGFLDGAPYVALEYLEGDTLDGLLKNAEPLETALAFEITRQALSAIAYAHEHDVVHRDLKPENIFVARDAAGKPRVKILDYGLAKFMAPGEDSVKGSALTMTGMVMGTPLYMPPEQAAGSSVDLPVDVYAMGCVLFEMLTGRPPFLGDTHLELLAAHLRAPIPKIVEARSGVSVAPELQALIDQALAKKQTARFPNAGAMLQALLRVPQPAITAAAPASPGKQAAAPTSEPGASDTRPTVAGARRDAPGPSPQLVLWIGAAVAAAVLATWLLR
jgi:serine/threonine-protein kinase